MKNLRFKKGFILAEALVAVTTLMAGIVAIGTIVNNGVAATGISKDYLVAQNLVTEAVESVKVVRDTNWMVWPQSKSCWMVVNPAVVVNPLVDCAIGQPAFAVQGTNYIVQINSITKKWELKKTTAVVDLDLKNNWASRGNYMIYTDVNTGQYLSVNVAPVGSLATKFCRSLKVVNLQANSATIEAKVQWKDGAVVREVKRNFIIYNYL